MNKNLSLNNGFRVLLCFILIPFGLTPQNRMLTTLDSLMNAECTVNHFNGNVLLAKSGHILYQKSFGVRDFETHKLLDNNSVFKLASVSKQFTAMGILLLKENGKLKLTDSLRTYLPELPYSGITIQNLLTHTSGLPDYIKEMAPKWDHHKIATNNDLIQFLEKEKLPLHFKPGTKYEYCNTAYALLASIIEKITGLHFSDYMEQQIFKPLKLRRTSIYNRNPSANIKPEDFAMGYLYNDSLKRYILPETLPKLDLAYYLDGIEGDGSVNSTCSDLLTWDRALKNHLLISDSLQKEMLTPHVLYDSIAGTYYGYGVFIGKNSLGGFISHNGIWPGYRTNLIRYPDQDITIIVLSNNQSNALTMSWTLANILYHKPVEFPHVHHEISLDTIAFNKFTGKYNVPLSGEIEIIQKNGKLYRHKLNIEDIELKPESKTRFYYADDDKWLDRQLEFETDKKGHILKAYFIYSGVKEEIQRL